MRIAYLGDSWGTSMHRFRALQRLGHDVTLIVPRDLLPNSIWINRWIHHTGAFGVPPLIDKTLLARVRACQPDLVWINQGTLIGPALLRRLRADGALLVNYINDDPFRQDGEWWRFRLYRAALPYYDLAVVCRDENINEARAAGARNVLRVWMMADEIEHKPRELTPAQRERFSSDVAFIGTWMPERGPFMVELIQRGVPISIWGDEWQKASEWSALKPYWRGPGMYDTDYASVILGAKICIGMLSKGNRDLHTRRSVEVSMLGGLLCAERTSEHLKLYLEGEEAIFWRDAEECAANCHALLNDDERRLAISQRGHERALRNNHMNEPVLTTILNTVSTHPQQRDRLRIAYLGDSWGTSMHRFRALQRLGHDVTLIVPRDLLPSSFWINRWIHHTGAFGLSPLIDKTLLARVRACKPDLVWVNQGTLIGPALLRQLRADGALLVNYINDDPFRQDSEWWRFRLYRAALPYYDLAVVCRDENINEAKGAGARNVLRVWMTADEIEHRPRELTPEERKRFSSDVAFIGTWMPERGRFMVELIQRGVPISIWGDEWQKASEWSALKPYWRGPGMYDADYASVILAAKICIGMLSTGNRDLHTTRSMEVPMLGGMLCAERTSEHLELYREGEEAIFWHDAEECAASCHALLNDEERRLQISRRGHERALRNNHVNGSVLTTILNTVDPHRQQRDRPK